MVSHIRQKAPMARCYHNLLAGSQQKMHSPRAGCYDKSQSAPRVRKHMGNGRVHRRYFIMTMDFVVTEANSADKNIPSIWTVLEWLRRKMKCQLKANKQRKNKQTKYKFRSPTVQQSCTIRLVSRGLILREGSLILTSPWRHDNDLVVQRTSQTDKGQCKYTNEKVNTCFCKFYFAYMRTTICLNIYISARICHNKYRNLYIFAKQKK